MGGGYTEPYASLSLEDESVHYNVFKAKLTLGNKKTIITPQKGNNTDSALTPSELSAYKENLVDMVIGNRIKSLGFKMCQEYANLESVTFGTNITYISDNAFTRCIKLKIVDIPDSVKTINTSFIQCSGLTDVTIGSGITSIGSNAFLLCTKLKNVRILATTPPTLGTSAFGNNASGRKIYVPQESVEAYKTATNWNTYANDILPIPTE